MMSSDVKSWRRSLRARLLVDREALPLATLRNYRALIDAHVERGFPHLARGVVAFCWPYRKEHDARFVARVLREHGAITALPVIAAPRMPLVFREWHPGVELARGVHDIPYPVKSAEVRPDSVLLPMLGFDDGGYRLGYGGGFFDRTLAVLDPRPLVIGIAYEIAHLDTIHPQPNDIPVDWVVTERGIYRRDGERLEFLGAPSPAEPSAYSSPVCYAGELDPDYFGK
jgi:5-formyltetrahydrofolate cyclo-ligase